jgi:hypothetical protein
MILEIKNDMKELIGLEYKNINSLNQNEKNLEKSLSDNIGDLIFPEYLVFGNERSFQKEADIFAVDEFGNLIVFELKVAGEYDRGKIYQALEYAQIFSNWQYSEMNIHFKKCFPTRKQELSQAFCDHFGFKLDESKFNRNQRILVISNGSSIKTRSVSEYWKSKNIDIEEYFYRIYNINGNQYFELSNELYSGKNSSHCWINTNKKYDENAYIDMVTNSKASTYGDKKYLINESLKGSYIFLYHNGYGIIGAGVATLTIKEIESNEEKYVQLKDFIHGLDNSKQSIEKFIEPAKIKKILNQDFYFAKTKVGLSEDQAKLLYKECESTF